VHRHALDLDAVVLVGVDRGLGRAPVVAAAPVVDELLQAAAVHAVVPVLVPASSGQRVDFRRRWRSASMSGTWIGVGGVLAGCLARPRTA
jgi:hypothetical protein